MKRHSRTGHVAKWIGTFISLLIATAFCTSAVRHIQWDSLDRRYEFSLGCGAAWIGWRPEGWRIENEPTPFSPGWSVARYGRGLPRFQWWPRTSAVPSWEAVGIPLWMPLALFAIPSTLLWWRDPPRLREAARRWESRLRPSRRKEVTLTLVSVMTMAHATVVALGIRLLLPMADFLFPLRPGTVQSMRDLAIGWTVACLLWAAPLWALLWSKIYVRTCNKLLERWAGHCPHCGYDLTGNVSGTCPECGNKINEETRHANPDAEDKPQRGASQ